MLLHQFAIAFLLMTLWAPIFTLMAIVAQLVGEETDEPFVLRVVQDIATLAADIVSYTIALGRWLGVLRKRDGTLPAAFATRVPRGDLDRQPLLSDDASSRPDDGQGDRPDAEMEERARRARSALMGFLKGFLKGMEESAGTATGVGWEEHVMANDLRISAV